MGGLMDMMNQLTDLALWLASGVILLFVFLLMVGRGMQKESMRRTDAEKTKNRKAGRPSPD